MNTFISWLFSDAGAGWIFGVLTLMAFIITRKYDFKPSRIVVEEKQRIEPVLVRKDIRERISISFDGREVNQLGQIFVDIFNEGNKTITNPILTIQFPEDIEILDGSLDDSLSGTVEKVRNIANIKFNFLNSRKEHRQVVKLSLVVNGAIGNIKVSGSGEGWSIRHIALLTTEQLKKRAKVIIVLGVILFIGLLINTIWLDLTYGIPFYEISIRAFIGYLPTLIPMTIWLIFVYQTIFRS
jgi:hypothetical protein